MTTLMSKWGNSLAVRIPKSVTAQLQVEDGDPVDITVQDGLIIIRPAARHRIQDLAEQITPKNRHRETDWGRPVGDESW